MTSSQKRILARILFAFLMVISIGANATTQPHVDPYVGKFDYGENRCDVPVYGFKATAPAVVAGANQYYNASGCGYTIDNVPSWPVPENPVGQSSCGSSSNSVPYLQHGWEVFNTIAPTITYKSGPPACTGT